jgi:hypothetical protein
MALAENKHISLIPKYASHLLGLSLFAIYVTYTMQVRSEMAAVIDAVATA